MYAIIESGDKQFRVEVGMKLEIPCIDAEAGNTVTFDKVLLCSNGEEVLVGNPTVANAKVIATYEKDDRGEKLLIFKKKRRKTYQKMQGHRQDFSLVTINEIIAPISAK